MAVRRIVTNIEGDPTRAVQFYEELLGLDIKMDMGWIRTYGADGQMTIQFSVMSQGGSGTAVPDMSIEVDDFDAVLAKAQTMGLTLEYGPAEEEWGVRRFYVRDPFGKLINVLTHL
ncbi:VOC family protein [Pelagibacterium sp.]|uniref:VOC family protein n=1 Tax=Pelagibacterium sp. TaxID=1967288 RepID=UPI003A90EDD4